MRKFIVLVLGLTLVAAACNKSNPSPQPVNQPAASESPTPPPAPTLVSSNTEIKMTASGFEPSSVTIKKGTTVTFVNNDTKPHQPASNPHPTHTDYPEFDPRHSIAADSSWSFTFEKLGTWKFHDHLNSSKSGSITVTE